MRRLFVKFVRIIKCCNQIGDKVPKNDKGYHICSILSYNVVVLKNMGLCLNMTNDSRIKFHTCHFSVEFSVCS